MNTQPQKMPLRRKLSIAIRGVLALGLVYLGLFVAPAEAQREIKRPEEVFLYTAETVGSEVIIKWDIADGYYMYRDKMKFMADGVDFDEPMFPDGEIHSDEFFGEQVIYRGIITIKVPVESVSATTPTVNLKVRSQGCADFGLCYPPQKWRTDILTPTAQTRAASLLQTSPNGGNRLLGAAVGEEPLPDAQAFVPSLSLTDPFNLEVRWDIAPGYYLYKKDFAVSGPDNIRTGALQMPAGVLEDDLEYGQVEVYFDSVVMQAPLSRNPAAQNAEFSLAYQGCKQGSICYPPGARLLSIELPEATDAVAPPPVTEQVRLFNVIAEASLASVALAFLGLGLLLAFSPCCLPMVPILSGIIAGQGDNITTMRSFLLSLSYVLGMAFTYTVAGAIVGAAGGSISAALQTPVVISFVALMFVALSLAMFGVYELQVPAALQTRLTALGSKGKAGSFIGTAIMGAISALVVSTCVAPPLVAALTVIAQTGDVARGAFALFALSIGMGIPLLVFGTSAGKLLPKAGPWMNNIKALFGFMLLGLAVWMLDRILPGTLTMALYAGVAVFAGIWFGALTRLESPVTKGATIGKSCGVLLLIYGLALGVGALSGSTNPLQPLGRLTGDPDEQIHLRFEIVKSVDDFEAVRQRAMAGNQTLMLDFYADWCVSCKEMEAWTFTAPQVQTALADTVLIQADVTANDEVDQALLEYFGIFGPPTIVFYDRAGNDVPNQRVIGYMATDDFLAHLDYVLR